MTSDTITIQNLISAIIGGLLVIIGQLITEYLKSKKERREKIIFLASKSKEIEQHLFNDLRELAMFKTHANYWWFCHIKSTIGSEYSKRYYDEHLRSQTECRISEKSIGARIAQYFGIVNEFLTLASSDTVGIISDLELIKKIHFRKAVDYDINDDYDEIRNKKIENDEIQLKNEYWNLLKPISKINNKLYNESKKLAKYKI